MRLTLRLWPRPVLILSRPPLIQKAWCGNALQLVTADGSEDFTARCAGFGGSPTAAEWMRESEKRQSSGNGLEKGTSTTCDAGERLLSDSLIKTSPLSFGFHAQSLTQWILRRYKQGMRVAKNTGLNLHSRASIS